MNRLTTISGLTLVIVIVLFIYYPIIAIWAINALFNCSVEYSLKNWFAMLLLIFMFGKQSVTIKTK